MSEFRKINRLLQTESPVSPGADDEEIAIFASYLSKVENLVVVVSDMARNTSRIYCGGFAGLYRAVDIGIKDRCPVFPPAPGGVDLRLHLKCQGAPVGDRESLFLTFMVPPVWNI